jgi:pyrroloquinoline quinone (PQQ) biosynthesis protein C
MKWLDKRLTKWFAKKLKQAHEDSKKNLAEVMPVAIERSNRIDNERTMNLNVTKANGGWVIEHRQYDKHKDRNNSSVHIITDDKDLGEELGKIITFESLYK